MFFHHNCLFCTGSFFTDIYRFVKRFSLYWSMKVGTLHNHWHGGWCLISLSRDICHQYKPSGHLYKRGKITNHPKWFFIIKVTDCRQKSNLSYMNQYCFASSIFFQSNTGPKSCREIACKASSSNDRGKGTSYIYFPSDLPYADKRKE